MGLRPFVVDADIHRLYVLGTRASRLAIVDTGQLRVLRTIKTGRHPEALDVHPGLHRAYVAVQSNTGTDKNRGHEVDVIDLRAHTIIDTIPTPPGPGGLGYDRNDGDLYVASESTGTLQVIPLPPRDR